MLIRVMYCDGHSGVIDDTLLDYLISQGNIRQFLRTNGWVVLGCDQVRRQGFDRRRSGRLVNLYV